MKLTQMASSIWNKMGKKYENSIVAEQIISEVLGEKAVFDDSDIDDGLDEGEDEYLMKDCFSTESGLTIRIYYGNNTSIIGEVTVREN